MNASKLVRVALPDRAFPATATVSRFLPRRVALFRSRSKRIQPPGMQRSTEGPLSEWRSGLPPFEPERWETDSPWSVPHKRPMNLSAILPKVSKPSCGRIQIRHRSRTPLLAVPPPRSPFAKRLTSLSLQRSLERFAGFGGGSQPWSRREVRLEPTRPRERELQSR